MHRGFRTKRAGAFWAAATVLGALAIPVLPALAQGNPAGQPSGVLDECRKVKKFKGEQSIDVVLCRDTDGVFRERAKTIGDSRAGFRGRVVYGGQFSGTTQRVVHRRQMRRFDLNSLLRDALSGGEPRNDIAGDVRLTLDFSGSSVAGSVSGTGLTPFSFQLSGFSQNGQCQLSDQSGAVTLTGRCSAEGFEGNLESDPERGTRLKVALAARAKAVTDFDERDLVQAGERAERERQLAEDRAREERNLAAKILLAEAGDVEAMFALGLIYDGSAKTRFTPYNIAEAARWYGRAGAAGHAPSLYFLAFIHYEGKLGARDDRAALDLFTRCAGKSWELQAQCHLVAGSLNFETGTDQGRAKAASHWRTCAKMGEADCSARLARFGL